MMNIHAEASDERARALLAGMREKIGALHQQIAELESKVREWQPIDSAPRDGTRFLAVVDGVVRVVAYGKTSHVPIYGFCLGDQGAEDFDLCTPECWQPMPIPPVQPTGDTK